MARTAPTFRRFIESISIDNAGSNYSSLEGETRLFISAPSGGPEGTRVQATADVEVNGGEIVSVTITEAGDGYLSSVTPDVYIQSGLNTGTSALTFTGSADSRRAAGTYTGVAVVSMKDGTGALATVVVDSDGDVTSVNVTTSGNYYMEGETVTITDLSIGGIDDAADMTFEVQQLKGGGNGAEFTANVNVIAGAIEYKHDNMSYIIGAQIPDFIKEDYPNFFKFIEDYYKFMDAGSSTYESIGIIDDASTATENKYSPNYLLQEMIDKLNLDHYDRDFLDPFLQQYALDFPKTAEVESRLLIKHIREFFEAKGSRKGVEAFFRMMYNEDVEVVLPSEFILKPSDGIWQTELTVKVYENDLYSDSTVTPLDLVGKRVDVVYYESTASITARKKINTAVTRAKKVAYTNPTAYELTLDIAGGTTIPGPGVEGELTAVIGGVIATVDTISAADVLRTAGTL